MRTKTQKANARNEHKEMNALFLDGFGCESLWNGKNPGAPRVTGNVRRRRLSFARRLLGLVLWQGG